MYSAYKLNKQGDKIQPCHIPFPILNQSVVPCAVVTVASWPAYRFLRRQVRWSGIPISLRIFQFVVIHTVKGFSIVNEAEVVAFLGFSSFFYDSTDVIIWSLVPLPFPNPACTPGISRFAYCWSLGWRILSSPLLACITSHPKEANYSFFSSAHRTVSRTDHILDYKTSLMKFKIETISNIFYAHNTMKLEMNYKKKTAKPTNTWRLNNMLLNKNNRWRNRRGNL